MRTFFVVLAFSVVVVLLHILSYFNPGPAEWGTHHYAFLPRTLILAGGVAALGLVLFAWLLTPGGRGIRIPAALASILAAGLGGVLFWAAREQGHFLGDGPSRIEGLLQGRFIWYPEPGGVLVPYYLQRLFGFSDPAVTFAALSIASGMLYLALSAWFAREVAGDAWGRGLAFGLFALAGLTRLFYGYVETAPLLAAITMLYLVVTVRYLRGHGTALGVALTGTLAMVVHTSALVLLPSMIYALWRGSEGDPSRRGKRLAALSIPVAETVAGHLYMATAGAGLGDVIRHYSQNLLPLTGETGTRVQYPALSLDHLSDVLQQEILVGPFVGLFAILLLVLGARSRLGPEGKFLLVAGVPWWVLSFFFNHEIGASRQWGVFAAASLPFLMLVGISLVRLPWRRERPRLAGVMAGVVLGVSVFHTLPWVALGVDRDRSFAHFLGLYSPGSKASPFARSYAFDQAGTHYLSLGQPDNAMMAYMEAVAADTTFTYPAGHLGSLLLSAGQTRRSATLLEWATRKDPSREYIHYELANAYRALGAPDSAAMSYRKALDLNPEFRQAYINLAVVEREQGNLAASEAVLIEAQKHYPQDFQILANMGRLEQDRGDTLAAIEHYKEALEQNPDASDTAFNLGNLLMTQGSVEEAAGYYEMVVNRSPRDAEAWVNLGAARDLLGREEDALLAFQQAMAADPARPEPYFNVFQRLIARGDTTLAVDVLRTYALRDSTTRFGVLARRLLLELGAAPGQ